MLIPSWVAVTGLLAVAPCRFVGFCNPIHRVQLRLGHLALFFNGIPVRIGMFPKLFHALEQCSSTVSSPSSCFYSFPPQISKLSRSHLNRAPSPELMSWYG